MMHRDGLLRGLSAAQQVAEKTMTPRLLNSAILFWILVASLGLLWEESCGNPVLFCYRISREILSLRGEFAPLAVQAECSTPSGTFCTPSTTSRV
jgi:hypothetical protein